MTDSEIASLGGIGAIIGAAVSVVGAYLAWRSAKQASRDQRHTLEREVNVTAHRVIAAADQVGQQLEDGIKKARAGLAESTLSTAYKAEVEEFLKNRESLRNGVREVAADAKAFVADLPGKSTKHLEAELLDLEGRLVQLEATSSRLEDIVAGDRRREAGIQEALRTFAQRRC